MLPTRLRAEILKILNNAVIQNQKKVDDLDKYLCENYIIVEANEIGKLMEAVATYARVKVDRLLEPLPNQPGTRKVKTEEQLKREEEQRKEKEEKKKLEKEKEEKRWVKVKPIDFSRTPVPRILIPTEPPKPIPPEQPPKHIKNVPEPK